MRIYVAINHLGDSHMQAVRSLNVALAKKLLLGVRTHVEIILICALELIFLWFTPDPRGVEWTKTLNLVSDAVSALLLLPLFCELLDKVFKDFRL